MATVLYGDPATGKTFNSEAIARAYGCKNIVDGWDEYDDYRPKPTDLLITQARPRRGGHRLIHINDALRRIGKGERVMSDELERIRDKWRGDRAGGSDV